MKKYKNCLVIGKFMPPHKGHEYMIRFAKENAENVHVVVDCLNTQTILPQKRKEWLEEQITGINVYAFDRFMPQEPSETPDFWTIWKNSLLEITHGVKLDLVVAAMDYGYELAKVMDCDFLPIDISRESIPVSATMIRSDIYSNWNFLMESVKSEYIQKFCFLGPESTGKSTLAAKIAQKLNCIYVPEYAKSILEKQGGYFLESNVETFVYSQIQTEKVLSRFSNQFLICDSSPITTQIYAELAFKKDFSWINEYIEKNTYKHIFLFKPDVPFVPAQHRQTLDNLALQKTRDYIFDQFEAKLKNFGFPYTLVYGSFTERENIVLNGVHIYAN